MTRQSERKRRREYPVMRLCIAQLLTATEVSEVGSARSELARAEIGEYKKGYIARNLINQVIQMTKIQTVVETLAPGKVQEIPAVVNVGRDAGTANHHQTIQVTRRKSGPAVVEIVTTVNEKGETTATAVRPSPEAEAVADGRRILSIKS